MSGADHATPSSTFDPSRSTSIPCKCIAPRLTLQHCFTRLPCDTDLQLRDRFRWMNRDDFGFGGNRVADKDRRGELPVLAEEHRTGARHIHCDERVKNPGCQSPLNDEASKL